MPTLTENDWPSIALLAQQIVARRMVSKTRKRTALGMVVKSSYERAMTISDMSRELKISAPLLHHYIAYKDRPPTPAHEKQIRAWCQRHRAVLSK